VETPHEYLAGKLKEYEDKHGISAELGLLVTVRERLLDVLEREGCEAPSYLIEIVALINKGLLQWQNT
jgi:hypothetical protein